MDTRKLVDEACTLADATRYNFERWKAAQEPEPPSKPHQMIHKTYEPPRQQQVIDMDAETQKRWDEWLDRGVIGWIDKLVVVLGQQTGKRLNEEVKKLQEEIGVLRADIEVMRSIVSGKTVEIGRKDARV